MAPRLVSNDPTIMPSLSLPNGKILKLVPERNVPENVCNYVHSNYEEITRRLTAGMGSAQMNNFQHKRLLVHADGTLEIANQLPTPPNNTSDNPIMLDDDDDVDKKLFNPPLKRHPRRYKRRNYRNRFSKI